MYFVLFYCTNSSELLYQKENNYTYFQDFGIPIGKQQGAKIICTIQKQINDLAFAMQ